jgi:hypothetical protein
MGWAVRTASPRDMAAASIVAELADPTGRAAHVTIHLATALRLADAGILDTVITYDVRLGEGSTCHGLSVISPGRQS